MYNSYYFTKMMVKERQRQLIAEMDRLRLIRAAKSTKNKKRKRIYSSISRFIKGFGTYLHRKHGTSTCGCPRG